MPRKPSVQMIPKLYPPLGSNHLPFTISVHWSVALADEHFGYGDIGPMPALWMTDALNIHAGEILPLIVGDVTLNDDLMHFSVQLRRIVREGEVLVERRVAVPFVYDRRTGHWSDGGLASGLGVLDFLLWHAETVESRHLKDRAVARRELIERLLVQLGTATLRTFAEAAGRSTRDARKAVFEAMLDASCTSTIDVAPTPAKRARKSA